MKLIFLGPPGSGKGTQAKMIAADLKISHISMGDILRKAIKDGTEVGKLAESYLKKGALVPDDVVNEIARQAVEQLKGFLLDGYPRTVYQAEFLQKHVGIDKVVYIDVPKDAIVKRLTGRLSCKNCGAVYQVSSNPPKKQGICDACGSELYIRNDDKEETIIKRFEVYEKETSKLIEFYRAKGILVDVDGNGSLDEVYKRIKAYL